MGIPAAFAALLTELIDYAGLYPPASLPLAEVVARYERYRTSAEGWMLNRLVLPVATLEQVWPTSGWRISLLVNGTDPGPLPEEVEAVETRALREFARPAYYEAPLESIGGGYAKVRTGGLTADVIPSSERLASFLQDAAARRRPFKATAGLHHPIRSERPLTYAVDSPQATVHGFINVFVAAAFAWQGHAGATLQAILEETDAEVFRFDDRAAHWRGRSLSTDALRAARRDFAHSFGSCSFEEPVSDLRELGWL